MMPSLSFLSSPTPLSARTESLPKHLFGLPKNAARVIVPALLLLVLLPLTLFRIFLPAFESALLEREKDTARRLVTVACELLATYQARIETGELPPDQARAIALEQIRPLRFGPTGKDYFWINDLGPTMVMHPYRPDLEGRDLSTYADARGTYLFNDFVAVASNQGSGFVSYLWQRHGNSNQPPAPKLSYVQLFEPWQWIVGTGVYLEEVEAEIARMSRRLTLIFLAVLGLALLLTAYTVRHGLRVARRQLLAEQELIRHQEQLEELVNRRTAELARTNAQLLEEINGHQRTQQHLKASEEKYRAVFEAANDAIFTLQDHRFVDCNPKTLKSFGCKPEELIGRSILDFSPETQDDGQPSRDKARALLNEALAGTPLCFEWRHLRCDDTPFEAEVSLTRVALAQGIAVHAVARDITNRKLLAREIEKNQRLESLGHLAGGIAHDFNNLLCIVLGNISLARHVSPDRQNELLAQAEKGCHRAKGLTRQLLTFARGGAPVKAPIDISEVVQEASRFAVRGTKVWCRYFIAPDLPPVHADSGQISQVIQNLVINAVQAMPEGGVLEIHIGCTLPAELPGSLLSEKHSDYVHISIIDHGHGIESAHLAQVFDPYFTTKETGSGLGLSIVHSIISRHGGTIQVDSKPGVGTSFDIFLPASKEELPLSDLATKAGLQTGSGRLLVMDDQEAIRETAEEILSLLGYTVSLATDGQEAIELCKKASAAGEPFAAVILDLTVPGGMGGFEAALEIRALDPAVRIFASSGYANEPILAEPQRHGFDGAIAKPYDIQGLANQLHTALCTGEAGTASTLKRLPS